MKNLIENLEGRYSYNKKTGMHTILFFMYDTNFTVHAKSMPELLDKLVNLKIELKKVG